MKQLNTYLTFDGNCREAMEFYAKCLGGKLDAMPFSQMPPGACGEMPAGSENRIMHACISGGPLLLMASDNMPGMPFQQGNNFSLNISCDSPEEQDKLFQALGDGGTVTMPLADAFWGARFGMLTDRFGINWMFNYEKAGQHAG